MTQKKGSLKTKGVGIAFATIIATGMISNARLVRAHDDQGGDQTEEARIHRGLAIAPVHLNLEGKDRDLVGLGSYWVNAVADCNGCHGAGPATEYIVPTGNPYFLSPPFSGKQQINPATYLGGGRDFGPFPGPPFPSIPHLYSRNLTPDLLACPQVAARLKVSRHNEAWHRFRSSSPELYGGARQPTQLFSRSL